MKHRFIILSLAVISILAPGCGGRAGSSETTAASGDPVQAADSSEAGEYICIDSLVTRAVRPEKLYEGPIAMDAYFGKIEYRAFDEKDMVPFPKLRGLSAGTVMEWCRRDTCWSNRVVLALRCPENRELLSWMSARVCENTSAACCDPVGESCEALDTLVCGSSKEMRDAYLTRIGRSMRGFGCFNGEGGLQVNEQWGLFLADVWHDGDLWTFEEATWYDALSCGNNTRRSWITVDASTGKELGLEDLVELGDTTAFVSLVYRHLVNHCGWWTPVSTSLSSVRSDLMKCMSGCALVKDGLVVYYHPYAIGCGADGCFSALIPYDEIRPLLKRRMGE